MSYFASSQTTTASVAKTRANASPATKPTRAHSRPALSGSAIRVEAGRNDAERNCVSNIRPEGLDYAAAANVLTFYLQESRLRKLTGVALKLRQRAAVLPGETTQGKTLTTKIKP